MSLYPCAVCGIKTSGWVSGFDWRCPSHLPSIDEVRQLILEQLKQKCDCEPFDGPCGRCNEILELMDYKGEEMLT